MGRPASNWEKAHHQGLKKGPWTPEEDLKLLNYIEAHGHGSWRTLPAKAGLKRCGKSCRLRWTNYLRPDIKRGNFSFQEEQTIIQLHALLGNRWSVIANHLCKRTDNEIKNYWNTHLKKRLTKMGIDPVTHKPKAYSLAPAGQRKDAANLSHMAQWESARLEAEARLGRDSKLQAPNPFHTQLGFYPTAPPPCLDMLTAWQAGWLRSPTDSATASGIFSAAGNLESLTSTMNFAPRNPLPALVTGLSFAGNSSAQIEEAISMKEEANIGKSMDTIMALSRNDHAYVAESLKTVNENILQPDFLDGLSDLLFQNSDDFNSSNSKGDCENVGGSCSDDQLEENKNYWNSILSLLNCPPSGSPVF